LIRTISVGQVIDGHKVGSLQVRIFVLCGAVLFIDGFDVQGISYVAPAISQAWALPRGAFGPTFSAGLLGVMLGALLLAPFADRVGRRDVIIQSCIAIGLLTTTTALAPGLDTLLVLRFFTGLGLGGSLPNAIALASEYSPHSRRRSIVMFVSSGVSLGSIAAGLLAARLIATLGWRAVFVAGGVAPLLLAVVLWRWLPESIPFAALLPDRQSEAKRLLRGIDPALPANEQIHLDAGESRIRSVRVHDLFRNRLGRSTALIWTAFFMSLLNVFLVINWLPTSLNASGFSVAQAATIASMYHLGGLVGTYACGVMMDRLGTRAILIFAFVLAAVGLFTFATMPPLPQWITTAVLMATGVGVIAAQVGLNTLTSMIYPVEIRSTGLGWALGIGRLGSIVGPAVGGVMLATGFNARHLYFVCIVPALLGAVSIALLRWITTPSSAQLVRAT
jgi:AAHS family 4-hydroxybenzoate transporter-like MFS transporter